jgi:NADH-quinone oxidoreductase subunit J
MLLNVPREEPAPPSLSGLFGPTAIKWAALISAVLAVEVVWALSDVAGFFRPDQASQVASVAKIGEALFTKHAFAFEVTSIVILVSMVGAVVLARKEHH